MVEALVLFDYKAQAEDELNLHKGDIIKQIIQQEGGWWTGTLNGSRGVFPDNFVQVIKPQEMSSPASSVDGVIRRSERVRRCRVLFSYAPNHEDELQLNVGEDIVFMGEVEEGWWKGSAHGKVGVFPSNFVSMVEEPVASESPQPSAPDLSPSSHAPSVPASSTTSEEAPKLPPKPVKEHARVLYPYAAQNEDELELREGDVITIISRDIEDKGWWRGELGGKIGVFPDNFVELIVVGSANHKPDRPDKPVQTATKRSSIESAKETPTPSSLGASLANKLVPSKKQWPPVSHPATAHESLSDEQKLKNLKPSPSSDCDLDCVEVGSDSLQHITANRVRMPKRRPPSTAFLKDENVWLANQDHYAATAHRNSADKEKELLPITPEEPNPPPLPEDHHQESKEPPPKAKSPPAKAPWMEELKKSQEKRQSISPKSETPPSLPNKVTPPLSAHSSEEKPSVPSKPAVHSANKPMLASTEKPKAPSFGIGSRSNSVLSSSSSGNSLASTPSQVPAAATAPNKVNKPPAPKVPSTTSSGSYEMNHAPSPPSNSSFHSGSSDLQQEVLSLRSQVRNLEDMVVTLKNELLTVRRIVEEERKLRLLRETSTPTIHL